MPPGCEAWRCGGGSCGPMARLASQRPAPPASPALRALIHRVFSVRRREMCDFSARGAHPLATGKEGWVRTRRGAASQPGLDGLALRYVSLSRTDSALTTPCLTVEG